jgi:hypothetical protein
MQKFVLFACLSILSSEFSISLQAEEPCWEKKPYTQWSSKELDLILNNSPWAKYGIAGTLRQDHYRDHQDMSPGAINTKLVRRVQRQELDTKISYMAYLLTARPVREACYRYISLGILPLEVPYIDLSLIPPRVSALAIVDVKNLKDIPKLNPKSTPRVTNVEDIDKTESAAKKKHLLDTFISRSPTSPIVTGEDKYIIIGVNLSWSARDLDFSNVMQNVTQTSHLQTDTGESIRLAHIYRSGVALQFYFPRLLPDGQSLVRKSTKDLWFETKIDTTLRIRVKFKPKKMLYKGKLEM